MSKPTVIQIIRDGLQAGGFDGLCSSDGECGCFLEDLAPCGESPTRCEPGYLGVMRGEFAGQPGIYASREDAEASKRTTIASGRVLFWHEDMPDQSLVDAVTDLVRRIIIGGEEVLMADVPPAVAAAYLSMPLPRGGAE